MIHRLGVALTLVAVAIVVPASAQAPQHFPQKYRNTDVRTLLAAAGKGDSEAMLWLGIRHTNGTDVAKDDAQAAAWYRRAADGGQASGMFMIGAVYWSGRGVMQDFVEAYKWLDLSAKHGNVIERERAIGARDSLARFISPQDRKSVV